MADSTKFRHLMADLLRLAVRSFCGTLFLMSCVGLMLAGGAYLILARDHVWVAGLGALAALIEALLVGSSWAFKRALLRAALAGLNRYGLGKATVRLLFGRALGPSAEEATGGWRGAFTRSVERLPLAEAERRLARAVQQKETSSTSGGLANRLWRWLQRRLVGSVQTLTLARLREYNARHGSVNLAKVQTELESHIDDLLVKKLGNAMNVWTLVVLVGLPVQVLAAAFLVLALLRSHGALAK
ncbi:MAG: hypothetical protein E6K70_21005 [Planctomycetota bacterium]|nr:MAG: hypothetical protein E6K70_21005 [Planctomycetota bacterium]